MFTKPQIETRVIPDDKRVQQLLTHQRITYGYMGSHLLELVKIGSFAPCVPDGENAKGEMRYRLQTPGELVARSVEITELVFNAMRSQGYLCDHPPLEELLIDASTGVGFGTQRGGR